jgi:hypothetical protein
MGFRWTEELKKVIDMLCKPEFDSEQVDPDLHKRMNKAIEDEGIKFFNMRESNLDGYQDLNFGTREMEDIVREIMEDPIKGNHSPAGRTCTLQRVQAQKNGRSHGRVVYIPVHTSMYLYVLVCTVLYLTYCMMHSLAPYNRLVVCSLPVISTFLSPADLRCLKCFFLERVAFFSRIFLKIEPATLWARCRAII